MFNPMLTPMKIKAAIDILYNRFRPMQRFVFVFFLCALSCHFVSVPSKAAPRPRFALLIGNQNYNTKVGVLKYPHQDVVKLKASLERLNFKVRALDDLDYKTMDVEIKSYARELRNAGDGALGFFYYSGHGAADPDTHVNYLIPVDVESADDKRLWDNSIRQDEILDRLSKEASSASHVVVFDACRSELNLLHKAANATGKEKGLTATQIGTGKGFTAIQPVVGMLIAYATAPNKSAADTGQFSTILAEELLRERMEIAQTFRNVQLRVKDYMNQEPWLSVGGIGKTYFTAAPEGQCNAVELNADGQQICRRPGDGQQFKDCEACPEMVLVPAGRVTFYDKPSFLESIRQKFTSTEVRLAYIVRFAEPLAVSRFPITFDEWDACVSAGGCAAYSPSDEGWERHKHPVINVSWNDAATYVAWLSERTGHTYRFLSESERKYLSENNQGGPSECNCDTIETVYHQSSTPVYSPGSLQGQVQVQLVPTRQPSAEAKKRDMTVRVDRYEVNEWGLYQIHGNVDEWLEDCWLDTIAGIPSDGTPRKLGNCEDHTIVGQAAREPWILAPYLEYRWSAKRTARDRFTGFRVVRALKP